MDRRDYVRLDRNEDPVGLDNFHFHNIISSFTKYDFAAYSDSTNLRYKLSNWLGTDINSIYVTAGSDAAIKNIFETYVDRGDKVILQKPSWRMYDVYNDIYNGDSIFIPYDENLHWEPNKIVELLNSTKIRLIVIANPNQPTGTVTNQEKIKEIIDLAFRKDTIVVIDEAYHLFTEQTCKDLIKYYDNLIIVRTFSKAMGLAGLRLGYCIANQQRIRELQLLRPVTDANGIALKVGEYILDNLEWLKQRVHDFIIGREFLYNKLVNSQKKTFQSETNFILIKYNDYEHARNVLIDVREKNYLLKGPFSFYPLENCIRITVASKELMSKFWDDCHTLL